MHKASASMALRACRRLVLLVDPLGPSTSAALRMALTRFAALLALQQTEDVDVGLAMVVRSGASVQLKVLYKPSRFVLRDFAVAVARLQPDVGPEGAAAWRVSDTKKLFLALRSLIQHLATQQQQQQGPHPRPLPRAPTPTRLVVLAHTYCSLPGNTLLRTLEEAAAAAVGVAFVRLGDEEAGNDGTGGHRAAAEGAGEAAQPAGGPEAAAATADTSQAFGRAVADSANGAYEQLPAADAVSLEHLYMRWLGALAQPLRDTHVRLELPVAVVQAGPTGQGQERRDEQQQDQGPGDGNGGSSDGSWFRGRLASQLGALGPRATPCPLCPCHGLPTAPPPPTGSLAPQVCAASGAPLLPRDAPPDPLTVRLGPGGLQELRLGPGAGPAALQAVVPNDLMQPEDGDPRDDAGGGETAMPGPHVVRLVVERLVPYEEVDASLVYGWPQLLLPVEGAGGAGAGRGSAEADKEQPSGELTLGAVSQVLQQCGGVLLVYGNVALCDGPTGHWGQGGHGGRAGGGAPPPPTSLRQWYLLAPGHNSFLLRQVACREQLIPMQPPTSDTDPSPDAVASAEHAVRRLPGWAAATASAATTPITVHTAPHELTGLEHTPTAPSGTAVEGSAGAIIQRDEAVRGGPTAVAAEPSGPPPLEPGAAEAEAKAAARTGAGDPGALASTMAACSLADAHAAQGAEEQQQQQQQQDEGQLRPAPSAVGPAAGAAAAGAVAADAAGAGFPGAPGSGFSPLLLSSGCHEVVAALLRASVRLAPRQPQPPPQQQQAAGPMGGAAAGALGHAGYPPHVPHYGQQPQQQGGGGASAGSADVPYPLDPRQQQQQHQQQLYYQQQPQQLQGQERPSSGSGAPQPAASAGGRLALSRALGIGPRGGGLGTAAAGEQQRYQQPPHQYQQQLQQPASSTIEQRATGARGAGGGGGGAGGGGGGMPGRAAGGGLALRSGSPAASASGPAGGQGAQQQPQPQQQGGAGGRRQALRLAPSRK